MRALDPAASADVGGGCVAPGHGQNPFDGRRIGRVFPSEPLPHGATSQRNGRRSQRPGVGGVELGGEGVEQVGVVAGEIGLPGEDGDEVPSGGFGEGGEQVEPHRVAQVLSVEVGRVVDEFEPESSTQGVGLGAAQGEDRPSRPGTHPGQPVERGATEEMEHHRLGLVVGSVAGEHVGRQSGIAGLASPGLEVGPMADLGAYGAHLAAEALGEASDDLGLRG